MCDASRLPSRLAGYALGPDEGPGPRAPPLRPEAPGRCGDDTWTGGPGTTFFLPRGLVHTFRSVDRPATILFLITPDHLDEFFRLKEEASTPKEVAALVTRFLQ